MDRHERWRWNSTRTERRRYDTIRETQPAALDDSATTAASNRLSIHDVVGLREEDLEIRVRRRETLPGFANGVNGGAEIPHGAL